MLIGGNQAGGVKVIISGNRYPGLLQEAHPWAAYDGRPSDLDQGHDALLMPWISENYVKVIGSLNRGIPTRQEQAKIIALAESVHAEGKRLRLWFTPESEEVWDILLQCGVDILHTDELEKMRNFIDQR
jgi:alkaline phosphatase